MKILNLIISSQKAYIEQLSSIITELDLVSILKQVIISGLH